jgi:hypothetical protein
MIDELPPDVRALVAASRSRLAPDPATVARLHARVHTAVAAGGVAAGTSAVIAKLAVVAVAAATVGTVAYVRHAPARATAPAITIATHAAAADEDVEVAPRISVVEREPEPPPPAQPAAAAVPPPPVPAAPHASLARETELVDQALQALHRGDHPAVLALMHAYDVETAGHGQLAQDAAAIAVEAACRSHDPTASTRFDAFTRTWPNSAQHARLAVACQQGDP